MTDNDRDVSQAARTVHDAFKRTPVRMTGGAGVLDMNGSAGGGAPDMEAEERRRQEEEADFTLAPDELDRWAGGGGAGGGCWLLAAGLVGWWLVGWWDGWLERGHVRRAACV